MSELTCLCAERLLALQAAGDVSALEITQAHLRRIERLDRRLGAFLRVNPRAEDDAAEVDRRRRAGQVGPLAGIPLAVKDNIATRGLATTAASRILDGFVPSRDATAVARMRGLGAVVLGKTNLDEFGMGSSTENSAWGATRNPWDLSRVPGGSSGGSAVAVAAGMAPLALGSDTGGSVRQPAAFCGVVGLKPTYGRVSRSGLIAFGSSLDQIGPLARSVLDAALALEALAGADPADATSVAKPVGDLRQACGAGVVGLRVGLPREYLEESALDPEMAAAVRAAAAALKQAGASVEEVRLPHTRYAVPTYYLVATAEASSNLARYDGLRFGPGDPAASEELESDLVASYRRVRTRGFGPEVQRRVMLGTFALSAGYQARFYGKAQRARTLIRNDFLALFDSGVHALLTPVTPSPAFRLGEKTGDPLQMYRSDVFTTTASLAGLPAMSVPAGTTGSGLPLAVQLIAAPFDESALFRLGGVLELAFPPAGPRDPGEAA